MKPRPIADLVNVLEETLAAGLSNQSRLTPEFRKGMIAPWLSEEGKLSLLRNASALNAKRKVSVIANRNFSLGSNHIPMPQALLSHHIPHLNLSGCAADRCITTLAHPYPCNSFKRTNQLLTIWTQGDRSIIPGVFCDFSAPFKRR